MAHSKPIAIMNVFEKDNEKFIFNNYVNTDAIFLHPEVADRKIVVLTTIGAFRKGKSFLLDYCLRFLYANYRSINNKQWWCSNENWMGLENQPLSGFSWKHGRKADTKGIIMWSDVFLHETKTEKLAIFVMDTQGLFEEGSTGDENSRIFGLGTLIASIQVINLKELIQEDQIEYLNMATSLSQMILQKVQDGNDLKDSKVFQKLIFLLRDWTDDELKVGFEGGNEYLNEFFNANYTSPAAKSVRKHIRDSFNEIHCYLLPHPGSNVHKKNFDGRHGMLEPEFVVALKEFIESILKPENLVKKSIFGHEVTAKEFRGFINSYFDAFASGDIPKVESILEVIVQKQINAIIDNCVEVYHQEIKKSSIDFDNEDREEFCEMLSDFHNAAKLVVLEKFKSTPKIKSDSEDYEANLVIRVGKFFDDWKADNLKSYDETIKLKQELKKMKLSDSENKKKLEEIEEEARKESRKNADMRANVEQESRAALEREELMKKQIEALKKRGLFKFVGEKLDDSVEYIANKCIVS